MKKLVFMAAAAVALLSSCKGGSPKANLKTDVDTLSYEIGLAQSNGLKMYLTQQLGVDTAYLDEFIKGVNEGAQAGEDKKKAAYYAGIQIGQNIGSQMLKGINYQIYGEDSTQTISLKNLLAGFIAGTTGKNQIFKAEEAFKDAQARMDRLKDDHLMKSFGANKKAGEEYIAKKSKEAGVKALPGGSYYKVIKEGNGDIPSDTTRIQVSYEGRTIDGKVFDSSYKNNNGGPVEVMPKDMIKGWTEALTRMPVGSTWELYIPYDQAYGNREVGAGLIKPYSALVFKLELVSIKK